MFVSIAKSLSIGGGGGIDMSELILVSDTTAPSDAIFLLSFILSLSLSSLIVLLSSDICSLYSLATSFLSTYVIANQISLTQIADSFELVTEDLSKSDETILPYEKMISLLTESKESLVFANQNANHSIFYKNGKLMNINEISEKIPSATDIPIKLEGVKSYSTFF